MPNCREPNGKAKSCTDTSGPESSWRCSNSSPGALLSSDSASARAQTSQKSNFAFGSILQADQSEIELRMQTVLVLESIVVVLGEVLAVDAIAQFFQFCDDCGSSSSIVTSGLSSAKVRFHRGST